MRRCSTVRFCELGLTIAGSWLEPHITTLYGELAARSLSSRPHFWLSSEWFTPDGVTGVAVPFYLGHPRLMGLEKAQMLEVEGGTPEWCLQILRHEAGHAFDNAYDLRKRRRRISAFGPPSVPYPDFYLPRPVLEELRAASRFLGRAESSGRRFRRELRRLAHARQRLAAALRRLAGPPQARVHERAHEGDRRDTSRSSRPGARSSRSNGCGRRCANTTRRSAPTTASSIPTSTTGTCAGCSPIRPNTRAIPRHRA